MRRGRWAIRAGRWRSVAVVLAAALLLLLGLVAPAQASQSRGGNPGWGPDHQNAAYCLSGSPLTVRVTYREDVWNLGRGWFPLVISWGDHTFTQIPTHRSSHPYDAFRPYQVDHTYAAGFNVNGKVITDNAHGQNPHWVLFLRQFVKTCPPPAQTPEVPFAVVLPLAGLAIVGVVVWRRQRRGPRTLRA